MTTLVWHTAWRLSLPNPVEAKYPFYVGKNLCVKVECNRINHQKIQVKGCFTICEDEFSSSCI